MATIGVFGLPGMGKTTLLTACADHWKNGKSFLGVSAKDYIFTNFYCQGCYKLDFEKLGLYNFHDCNILIDEIMLFADCRNFKNFSDHLTFFFAMARHFNVSVVWCSQYWSDCDRKIRNVTEKFYLLEKGKILKNFSFVKPITRVLGINKDKYTLAPPIEWTAIYRPKYYKKFNSFETLRELPPVDLQLWESKVSGISDTLLSGS